MGPGGLRAKIQFTKLEHLNIKQKISKNLRKSQKFQKVSKGSLLNFCLKIFGTFEIFGICGIFGIF